MIADPQHLHQTYCELTGFPLRWDASRRYPWELFSLRFTEADLRLVIRWIQGRQRLNKPARSLLFRSFIAGPSSLDEFEEDMCQARAEQRTVRVNPAKAQVLRATCRSADPEQNKVESAKDAFERTKLAAQLAEWKKTL